MKMTRSTLLILALSAMAVGLVIVMGVRLDRVTEKEIVTRFSQHQLLLAEQSAAGVQSIFDEARRNLLHIKEGGGPACLADALGAENEEDIATCRGVTEQGLSSYLRSHPIYTQIRYIDASGQEIVAVDSDGETVRVVPQDELRSQAEREFFVATMQLDEGGVYVSPLEPALGHGGVGAGLLTIRLATPVFDSQGRRAGIVVINLLADEIRAHVARLSAEEGVDAWVLDETGVDIISVTNPELEGSNTYEYCQQTGNETLIALAEDMLAGGRGTGTYLWPESEGGPLVVKKLMAYAPVYPAEGQVWSVGTSVPYDTILAAHRQTHRMLLFLGGGIVTIVLAGAVLAAQLGYKRVVAEERARLSETLRRQGEELEALREISLAISTQLELDELLRNIVKQGCHLLDVRAGGVYLVDAAKGDLELVISHGYTRDYTGTRMAPGEGTSGKVLQSGESLIVDDYHHWEGRAPGWEAEPITANLGVPLKRGEQIIGALVFDELAKVRRFDEHDVWLATLFANQATIAIENARLYRAEQAARERADTLREVSRVVGSTLELDEVLSLVLRQAKRVLTYDTASILLFASGEPTMVAVAGYEDEELVKAEISLCLDDSPILQAMARDHRPIVIGDVREDERWIRVPGAEEVRAWIGVPLLVRDEMIGALMIDSAQPGFYTEADAATAQALANQAAVAIENARLFEAEQRRRQEAETLRETALALTTSLDRNQVIKRILIQLRQVVPYDSASVQLLHDGHLEIIGGHGFPNLEELLGVTFDLAAEDNPNREVMRTRAFLILEDAPAAYVEFSRGPHAKAAIRSWLGVPMLVGDQPIGMIALDKREPGFYTEEHARLAQAFAAQASIAIENARLYEAEREQRELAEALEEAAAAVSSTLRLDQVLDRILEQVERVVAGDAFNIMLLEDSTARVIRWRGYKHLGVEEQIASSTIHVHEYPNLVRMMQAGKPVVIPDTAADPAWVPNEGQEWRCSYVAAPIRVKDLTVGLLNVDGTRPGQFGLADARRLAAFADHAAPAIENARLYQEMLNYTDQLEQRVQERTAELQAQYARLDAILRSASDGIVVTDAEGEIIQTNPVAHTWLAQSLSPEDAARMRETVRDLARRADERPEAVLELKGLDLELKAAPIPEPGMEETAAVVAVHDVSHLKALDRMKSRFVSNISHELRTPITTIKLYAALLRKASPGKREGYLETLEQETEQLARLIEDILHISRIDAGRLGMEPRPTPLNELTEVAVVSHQTPAQNRGLTLEHRPAELGPVAPVDPEQMMQALNNLVANAIQYTPEGGKVVISTGKGEAEGRAWATLTVADTGIGIPEEELPHIFERFFRGDEPRLMQMPGTGLGLAIAKEIVELHGGRVTVESQVGKGTTFTVWLPLTDYLINELG